MPKTVFLKSKMTAASTRTVISTCTLMVRIFPEGNIHSSRFICKTGITVMFSEGRYTALLLEKVLARPWATPIMPKVAIKGATFSFTTTIPLRKPNAAAVSRPSRIAAPSFTPHPINCAITIPISETRPPTDRSIPPVIIARDMAELNTIRMAACPIRVERLVAEPKFGIKITNARNNAANM